MRTSIRYILLCALRDKLFPGLLFGVLLGAMISSLLGSTAFLEEREMTLAFAAAGARLILVVGLIVFVCFHIRHAFESREIDVMLSRPISRHSLVIAFWLGFAVVATLLVLPMAAILLAIGPLDYIGFAVWSTSVLLETWLMVGLALFAALALKSAVSSVMCCLGFYFLSRMMAYFVMTADSTSRAEWYITASTYVLKTVSMVVPRLDFFGKSQWLVYGMVDAAEWQRFVLQAAFFIPLVVIASIVDFRRKAF